MIVRGHKYMELTDDIFCSLMDMRKRFKESMISLPALNQKMILDVISDDNKEAFIVDIDRTSKLEIKTKVQERYGGAIPLVRIEVNAPPHTNPDGSIIGRDHIHIYKHGYGLSWAYDLANFDNSLFKDLSKFMNVFIDFCKYCNIEVDDSSFQVVI